MASKSLGTLTLDLIAKIGGFEAGMDKAARKAKKSGKDMADSADLASKAWKALGGVLGTIGAGGALLKVVENTKLLDHQQAQLGAVLRSTGEAAGYSREQLNAMAGAMSSASMFNTGEITEAQTTLLAFTGIVGDQFPKALQAAADMATRTGMSVKSAAETIGRALDVPSRGLGSLSDQGFRFTDEQKKLAKQLESTGRTAEAQAIILDALEESYAGAAQAARDTFGGALAALQSTIDTLMTGGDGTISAATAAVNDLNDVLSSPEAAVAIDLLTDAVIALAAVVAGRLVGSAAASAVAFASAQVQAARYQAALAGMAGVSKAAAVGIGAVSVAARASSAAFALVGGPFGAAALAAIAVTSFALSGEEAKQPTDDLAKSVRELSSAAREVAAIEAARKIDELSASAANLAANLAYAEENSQGAGKRSKRFAEDAAYIRLELEKTGAELAKYQKRLDDIKSYKPTASGSPSGSGGADEDSKRAEKARLEGIAREITALERAASVWGMTADQVVLYDLAAKGATDTQLAQAEASLAVVAGLEKQAAAVKALNDAEENTNREAASILDSLLTEEEQIKQSYGRRRQIIMDATLLTEQQKNAAIVALQEEHDERMLELNGGYWERYMAAAQENLLNFDELSGEMLEGLTGRFGDAFESMVFEAESLGEAFSGLAEGMARSVVNAIGEMAAQWLAYQALELAGVTTLTTAKTASASTVAAAEIAAIGATTAASAAATATTTTTQAAAAATTAAAWTPAAIVSSIGSFGAAAAIGLAAVIAALAFSGGFRKGGYTGGGGVDDIAGVVHGKEFVFDAESTSRIGVANLEAMRQGKTLDGAIASVASSSTGGGGVANVQIINNGEPMRATSQLDGDTLRIILERVQADIMGDGKTKQAIGQKFGLEGVGR